MSDGSDPAAGPRFEFETGWMGPIAANLGCLVAVGLAGLSMFSGLVGLSVVTGLRGAAHPLVLIVMVGVVFAAAATPVAIAGYVVARRGLPALQELLRRALRGLAVEVAVSS